MHDFLLHEMAKIRIEELRTEASRRRTARKARGPRGWRLHLGILGGLETSRTESVGFTREKKIEEACCA